MKFAHIAVCCGGIGAIVIGCAATPVPGAKPGDIPPRLVMRNNVPLWDNPAAFGPVPAELAQAAQSVCSRLNTRDTQYKATGYHSKALNTNVEPIRGGGYYCVRK